MVKIITDSLSDISPQKAKELGITVVPLNVHFGNEVFKDYIDLSPEEFYQKLVTSKVHPTTSAPAPGLFVQLYEEFAKETKEIIAIMASNKLSAVQESAIQAKAMVKADVRIEIINTEQLIGAEAIPVYIALEAAKKGATLDQIKDLVTRSLPRIHSRMAFDTLEYLEKGGRIGKAKALVGGLLKIHPMLGLKDGMVHPFKNARSRVQAIDLLVSFVKELKKIDMMVIEHATTPDDLEILANRLGEFFPKEKMIRSRVGPVIGVHTGPHVLALCVLEGE